MYFVRRQTENGQSAEDAEQSALSDSVRNSVLMLSERSLKWPHLPLRIKSMQIWSLILDRAQNDEMMELIGFDAERSEFSQSEQFENDEDGAEERNMTAVRRRGRRRGGQRTLFDRYDS